MTAGKHIDPSTPDPDAVRRVNEMFDRESAEARSSFLNLRGEHGASPWTFIVVSIFSGLCGVLTVRAPAPYNLAFFLAIFTLVPALGLAIELARARIEARRYRS